MTGFLASRRGPETEIIVPDSISGMTFQALPDDDAAPAGQRRAGAA